jgi:Mrp family chromosome partitioning ATPase
MEQAPMKNVEQSDSVENQQITIFTDPSETQKHPSHKNFSTDATNVAVTHPPAVIEKGKGKNVAQKEKKALQKSPPTPSKRVQEEAQMVRIRCKQLCVSTFFQSHTPVRSLGFTSAIPGEGKSFLARVAAEALADDDSVAVTLLECNWEHPSFNTDFNLAQGPGLAEWLRQECSLDAIRHQTLHNLTVIPAGESKNNAIGLLRAFHQRGVLDVLTRPNEVVVVDLPSVTTTPYGQLAASMVDSLILVVRMGVTPESFIIEANSMLKDLPMQGIIFNSVVSQVPRWLRQIL